MGTWSKGTVTSGGNKKRIKMLNVEWVRETERRLNLVVGLFKPNEVMTIADFITTAGDVSKEERTSIAEKQRENRGG